MSSSRPRTEAEGGDALCNQLNRLPQELFEMLMNTILKNASADACAMIQYIDWQKCGLHHVDLSKDETWFELLVRIFNQVPYGRSVTDAMRQNARVAWLWPRSPDESQEWKHRFGLTCQALRNFKNGLDAWIERAKNDPDSIRKVTVTDEGRSSGKSLVDKVVIENSVSDVSTSHTGARDQIGYFASVFTAFAKLLSQRVICAELQTQILDKRTYENENRKVAEAQREIEDKTGASNRAPTHVEAVKLMAWTRELDKLNMHVEKRRRALTRLEGARDRMNNLIAGYRQAWGVNPPFAPQPIAIDLASEDESEDED